MSAKKLPAYPATCPNCLEPSGWPFSAGTCERPEVIVVKLRCQVCTGEWTADAPKPAMAMAGYWPARITRRPATRIA